RRRRGGVHGVVPGRRRRRGGGEQEDKGRVAHGDGRGPVKRRPDRQRTISVSAQGTAFGPRRRAAEQPDLPQIVEQRVGDRRDEQRQQERQGLAAEDDEPDRVVGAGADPTRDDEREHAGDEGAG